MQRLFSLIRYDLPLHFTLLLTAWMPDFVICLRFRGWLAHFFFKNCGKNLRLGRGIVFYNPSNIYIGNNVYIAYGNWFSAMGNLKIGNDVLIGPKCIFSSSNHTLENNSFRYGKSELKSIKIGNGSWIAGNCSITAGTEIGETVVVGAGSVLVLSLIHI